MCFEDNCIPYCARNIGDPICKDWVKEMTSAPKTNEVCINVEYDGDHVPGTWEFKSCGGGSPTRGEDCGHAIPSHVEREDENICVDIYDDNYANAATRLDRLTEQKVKENNWQNVKYYCMYGVTEFFMSLFQKDSLAYSDKYCGRASDATTATAKPAAE